MLTEQVDRSDQRLGLHGSSRAGREGVAVWLGIHLDHAVRLNLGVQHVRAGAEVHDVQHRDILAEFLLGDLQVLAQLRRVEPVTGAARVDQDARERHQPGESFRADGGVRMVAVAVVFGALRTLAGFVPGGGLAESLGHRRGIACVALDHQFDPVTELGGELFGPEDPGVLAESEDPGDQLAGVRVGRDEHAVAVVAKRPHLPVRSEVALDLPRDSAG